MGRFHLDRRPFGRQFQDLLHRVPEGPISVDESQARSLIADHLGVAPASVADETPLAELGADPLDVVGLVLRLERAFGVRISDTQAEACRTVGDLFDAVRSGRPMRRAAFAAPVPA